nr:SufD family Fe-S cluster assembly protein [Candidatus Gracilibacteria bacterium]
AEAHYIEGCSAPKHETPALHAGGVEIYLAQNAKLRYSSVENWSLNTYNLNTKRAILSENAHIEWVGGNLGAGLTMLYPCSVLKGEHASAKHYSAAWAKSNQIQDMGAKVIHLAPYTRSEIISKSVVQGNGQNIYRGLVKILAPHCFNHSNCDTLLLDSDSYSNTIPDLINHSAESSIGHEASVGSINPEDLAYLNSRGLNEEQSTSLLVSGFLQSISRELPLEYASEMNQIIKMDLKNRS